MNGKISRLIAVSFLVFLNSCYWNEPPPKDTIVFAIGSEPKTLDPRYATDAGGQRIGHLIFSSLIKRNKKLETVGNLASSWSYKDLVYTFELKPGIYFHNGDPATSRDFVYSIEQYQKNSSPFSAQFKVITKADANYDVKTGGTLKIYLETFASSFITNLPLLKLLQEKFTEKMGENFYKNPMGTGPMKFANMDIKNIHLERNDQYFGEAAKSKKLQFKVIKDSNTRFQKMYKGQIDIVQSEVPFSKVQFFKRQNNFSVVVEKGLSTTYLLLNLKHEELSKSQVRHAISSAINREEIIKYTHEGYAEKATSIITKANPYHDHTLKYKTLTKDEVKSIFSEMNEKPIILKTSNTQEAVENGRVLAHQLKSLGLNVEQQSYEWGTYYEDVRTGKFDMAVMKWVGISDPDIYRTSLHSEMTPPGRNRGYYNNKILDKLVDKAFIEPDEEIRKQLYLHAQKVVFHDLPTIPLWYEKQVAIIHKRVKNYTLPMSGDYSALLDVYKENE